MSHNESDTDPIAEIKGALHRIETRIGLIERSISLRRTDVPPGSNNGKPSSAELVKTQDLPLWMTASEIEQRIGLRVARLRQFHEQGWVRRAKLGEERQAAALFNVKDVLDVLEQIATGRTPKRQG